MTIIVPHPKGFALNDGPSSYTSVTGVPAAEVLATMQSVADVGTLLPAGDRAVTTMRWAGGPAGVLRVDVDLALRRFYDTPGNAITARIVGTPAERAVRAYAERLDASGLRHVLTVAVYGSLVLQVDRR